jgi:hypothetical protein
MMDELTREIVMREHILSEIRRLAEANGGQPPGRQVFERETGIGQGVWLGRYWARWGDALSEAGYEPNALQGRADETLLCKKFIDALRHYQRIPSSAELRLYGRTDPDFPSHNTFGTKAQMLRRVAVWVNGKAGYADVAALLGEAKASSAARTTGVTKEGYVYLIQSGAHYKIPGRSKTVLDTKHVTRT